jgi:DNA phosphorothioation-dependent restriction protein DptG
MYATYMAIGAKAGSAFSAETMGISIAVGALAGAIMGWVAASKAAAASAKEAASKLGDMKGALIAQYGSMEEAAQVAGRFGLVLENSIGSSANDLKQLSNESAALEQKLKDVADAVQRYGLTWTDMVDPADIMQQATSAAKALLTSYTNLTQAGYKQDAVINAMSGDINVWLANVLAAGAKIPPEMQPIFRS